MTPGKLYTQLRLVRWQSPHESTYADFGPLLYVKWEHGPTETIRYFFIWPDGELHAAGFATDGSEPPENYFKQI